MLVGTQHAEDGQVGYEVGFDDESHLVVFLVVTPLDGLVCLVWSIGYGVLCLAGECGIRNVLYVSGWQCCWWGTSGSVSLSGRGSGLRWVWFCWHMGFMGLLDRCLVGGTLCSGWCGPWVPCGCTVAAVSIVDSLVHQWFMVACVGVNPSVLRQGAPCILVGMLVWALVALLVLMVEGMFTPRPGACIVCMKEHRELLFQRLVHVYD